MIGGRRKSPRDKVQPSWSYGVIGDLNWVRTSEKLECGSSLADMLVGVVGWLQNSGKEATGPGKVLLSGQHFGHAGRA